MKSKVLLAGLLAFSAFGLSGCYVATSTVTVRTFSTTDCYWEDYGTYEQQFCYSPYYGGYRAYYVNDVYVRRYRPHYVGPRVVYVGTPGVIVHPRRAPVYRPVRPVRPVPRRHRHHATQLVREHATVSFDKSQLKSISLEGNAFASAEVRKLENAPVGRVQVEVVVAAVNRKAAQELLKDVINSHDLNRGNLTVGEGVSDDNAFVQRIDVVVPRGANISVR